MRRIRLVDLTPGQWLGEWILEEHLGEGGFAVVYRARHSETGAHAAVKVLTDPRLVAQLKSARTTLSLEHPNVVRTQADALDADPPHLVLELAEGGSLRGLLSKGRVAPARVVEIVRNLAAALDHAHGAGVLHLDVKPENALLDAAGQVLLTDFGAAGGADREGMHQSLALSQELGVAGTPDYAAPEVRYADGPVDGRADVYSLGVVAFELLTGRLPLGLDRPSELVPGLPTAVDQVLAQAMAREPHRRTLSAGALAVDLERALRGGEALADPVLAEQAPPRPRRSRLTLKLAAVCACLAALGALVWPKVQPKAAGHPRLASLLEHAGPRSRVGVLLPVEDLGAMQRGWARSGTDLLNSLPHDVPPRPLWTSGSLEVLYERGERDALAKRMACDLAIQAVVPSDAGPLEEDAVLFLIDLHSYEIRAAAPTKDPLALRCAQALAHPLDRSPQRGPFVLLPTIDASRRISNRATAWFDARLTAALRQAVSPHVSLRARAGLVPRVRSFAGDAGRALSAKTIIEGVYDPAAKTISFTLRDVESGRLPDACVTLDDAVLDDYEPTRDAHAFTLDPIALKLGLGDDTQAVLAEAVETARALLYQRQPVTAQELLETLRRRGPPFEEDLAALLLLAQAHLDQGHLQPALGLYAHGVELHPNAPLARDAYARACLGEARLLFDRGKRAWYRDDDESKFARARDLLDRLEALGLSDPLEAEVTALRQRLEREL